MQDRWPYPIAQAMQRQTGCRIARKTPAAPPLAPEAGEGSAAPALQPALPDGQVGACQGAPHTEE